MEVITLYRGKKQLLVLKAAPGRPPLPAAAVEAATAKLNAFMAGSEPVFILSLSPGLDVEVHALDEPAAVPSAPAPLPIIGNDRVMLIPSADPDRVASYDEQTPDPVFDPAGMDVSADPQAMPAGLGR